MKHQILTLLLSCSLGLYAASYEATTTTLPILNDGEPTIALRFNFKTEKARTLTSIQIDTTGTTELTDLQEISILMDRRAGDLPMGKSAPEKGITALNQSTPIPAGEHTCKLVVRTKKDANLLHRVGLQITGFTFKDGTHLRVDKNPGYSPARLAYPIHKRGQHNCHTFRIPAIAKANDGSLLAVYDMRYNSRRDLQEHMDIGLSRSTDGGQSWATPVPHHGHGGIRRKITKGKRLF